MGIDAKILIRYTGPKPTKAQLTKWSKKLTKTVGSENFYTGQYAGRPRRAIELTNSIYEIDSEYDIQKEYREPGRAYLQDGPTLFAEPDEWFLDVSVDTRYYGIHYERGDLLTICRVAAWAEENIMPCKVWYGGDSSEVKAEPFGAIERAALLAHMNGINGRAYYNGYRQVTA